MNYSHEVINMKCIKQGPNHGPAPIPQEGNWTKQKKSKIFPVCHTVSAGVHHNRDHAS